MSSVALALAPKPFCALSILCSYVVIRETSHPANRTSKRDRAMRACLKNFAIADLIFSVAYIFTTWPMPADALDYFQNVGTTATCSAQGFFIEFGAFASSLFSVDLSVLFVLMVRYNALESTLVNFQYWSQIVIWGLALGFSVLYLALGFYNPNTAYCWIGPYPYDCWWSEEGECLRGMMSFWAIYTDAAIGFLGPLASQIFLFVWLYRTVHEIEDPTRRQSQSTRQFSSAVVRHGSSRSINDGSVTTSQVAVNRTRSRAVAVRGLYYIGGYLLTYLLSFIELVLQFFSDTSKIAVPAACLLATQGLWTAIVFTRNREMLTPEGNFLRKVLWCCMPASSDKHNDSTSGGRNASTKFPSGTTNLSQTRGGSTRVVVGFDGKPTNVSDLHNSGLGQSTQQHDRSGESEESEEQQDDYQDSSTHIAEIMEMSSAKQVSPAQKDETTSTEKPTQEEVAIR